MFFERLLVAVVSVLIAAIVVSLFVRALRGPEVIVTTVGGESGTLAAGDVTTTALVPITFPEGPCAEDAPEADAALDVLTIYYTCGNGVLPTADSFVYRRVPQTDQPFQATLRELLQGPSTREAELGFRSAFSVASAGSLASAEITSSEAVVDFTELPIVTGLSAADDVGFFVANLNANVFQFEDVASVEYRLDGSCADFWEHLGDDTGCRIVARENHEATMARNRGE